MNLTGAILSDADLTGALLSDADLRQRLRKRGREVAEQWRAEKVAVRLENFFHDRSARTP